MKKASQKEQKGAGAAGGVTVSVRSSKAATEKKRKGAITAEEVYAEEIGNKEAKRLKKGLSKGGK